MMDLALQTGPHGEAEDSGSVLRYYLALECASHQMLEAARAGDWDSVCRLEGACAVVIATLRRARQERPLTDAEQPERVRVLKVILANDAEIRRICDPLPSYLDARYVLPEQASFRLH